MGGSLFILNSACVARVLRCMAVGVMAFVAGAPLAQAAPPVTFNNIAGLHYDGVILTNPFQRGINTGNSFEATALPNGDILLVGNGNDRDTGVPNSAVVRLAPDGTTKLFNIDTGAGIQNGSWPTSITLVGDQVVVWTARDDTLVAIDLDALDFDDPTEVPTSAHSRIGSGTYSSLRPLETVPNAPSFYGSLANTILVHRDTTIDFIAMDGSTAGSFAVTPSFDTNPKNFLRHPVATRDGLIVTAPRNGFYGGELHLLQFNETTPGTNPTESIIDLGLLTTELGDLNGETNLNNAVGTIAHNAVTGEFAFVSGDRLYLLSPELDRMALLASNLRGTSFGRALTFDATGDALYYHSIDSNGSGGHDQIDADVVRFSGFLNAGFATGPAVPAPAAMGLMVLGVALLRRAVG